MKRKLDITQQPSQINNEVEVDESLASTNPLSSASTIQTQNKQTENKRIRCDTPPPESNDSDLLSAAQINEQNRRRLKTIELKILELQNELDALEYDVENHEDNYLNAPHHNRQNSQMSEQDAAEALGFAMCAQETMLFLQREGVPADSVLYTRLHDALVGFPEPDEVFYP